MDGNLDLSAIIGRIMSDESLMNNIKSAVAQSGGDIPTPTDGADSPSAEDISQRIPTILSALSSGKGEDTATNASHPPVHEKKEKPPSHPSADKSRENRKCLLNALKPYLSHNRCEAIDYLLSLSEITSLASVLLPNLQNFPNIPNSKQGE